MINLTYIYMKKIHKLTYLLLALGGLNWLLLGIFGWEVGELFGGQDATVSKIIYVLVGISAVIEIIGHKAGCKHCEAK